MVIVIGPTRSTVVTLSRNADKTAVITIKATMIFHGLPWASLAALIAIYSKIPEFLTTATKKHHADQNSYGIKVYVTDRLIDCQYMTQHQQNGACQGNRSPVYFLSHYGDNHY